MQQDEDNMVLAALFQRTAELQETGLSHGVAFSTAQLELRIACWPEKWGNNLQVLIYGDFDAPVHDLAYPKLGIVVEAGKRTNTIIKTALCVVRARRSAGQKLAGRVGCCRSA